MANLDNSPAGEHWFPASLRIIVSAISKMDEERVIMCVLSFACMVFTVSIAIADPHAIIRIVETSNAVWAAPIGAALMMFVRRLGDKNSSKLAEEIKEHIRKAAA